MDGTKGGAYFIKRHKPALKAYFRILLISIAVIIIGLECWGLGRAEVIPSVVADLISLLTLPVTFLILALLIAAVLLCVNFILAGGDIPPGFCRVCRYDLTGNVSGRCPECGTTIDKGWAEKPDQG